MGLRGFPTFHVLVGVDLVPAAEVVGGRTAELEQLAAESACSECAATLRSAATQLRERLAPPPAIPVEPPVAPMPEGGGAG